MAVHYNPSPVFDESLDLCIDPANARCWPGSGTTLFDLSSNSANLTLTNAPVFSTSTLGEFTYNGTDEYASIAALPNAITGNAAHTIEAWIKPNSTPTIRQWPLQFGQNDTGAHQWAFESDNGMRVGIWGGNQIVVPMAIGQWHHIVASWSAYKFSVYKNGIEYGTFDSATGFNLTASNFDIAKIQIGEAYFNGAFGIIKMYSRALTADQVNRNFVASHGRYGI